MSSYALCAYHRQTLRNLRQRHPHLTKKARTEIAFDLWRQCCQGPLAK